jgi:hypothetical protein
MQWIGMLTYGSLPVESYPLEQPGGISGGADKEGDFGTRGKGFLERLGRRYDCHLWVEFCGRCRLATCFPSGQEV